MIIHVINDNILSPHMSYLGVYQDEVKNESFTKINIYIFWVGTKPKKSEKRWCTFLRQHWEIKNQITNFMNGCWVLWANKKESRE